MKESVHAIPIERLQRGRYQPRRNFDPNALAELATSIKANGLVQPIIVRQIDQERYEIVAGERRWRAAQMAGLTYVPSLVKDYSDEQMAAAATIENINRVDLNPIEEAGSYQKLIADFSYTHDELAAIVGKSREKISNLLRLLKLEESVKTFITQGQLTEGHGKLLVAFSTKEQYVLAQQTVREKLSVNQLAKVIKSFKKTTNKTPSPQHQQDILAFEKQLSEQLGTPVKLEAENVKGPGWIKVRYFDLNTLMGLVERMGIKTS